MTGGVFFPGYIHLFHIYGLHYVPIVLILAIMLHFHMKQEFGWEEGALTATAIVLAFWHPFTTAIFLGFYFGQYLEGFRTLKLRRHCQVWIVLIVATAVTLGLVLTSFGFNQPSFYSKLLGFLISYRTNEINLPASMAAWLLAYVTVFSMNVSLWRLRSFLTVVTILGASLLLAGVPLLLLWILVVAGKLLWLRNWGLLVPLAVSAALPCGGGIGGPVYALFPIILATFATSWGWYTTEALLRSVRNQYLMWVFVVLLLIVLAVRTGARVPVVSAAAAPLLAERERTYQLEDALSWLATSKYCAYDLAFMEGSGNPVESVEGALNRRRRPPAALVSVLTFWDTALRCVGPKGNQEAKGVVTITFGGQSVIGATAVYELPGRNAGPTTAWVRR